MALLLSHRGPQPAIARMPPDYLLPPETGTEETWEPLSREFYPVFGTVEWNTGAWGHGFLSRLNVIECHTGDLLIKIEIGFIEGIHYTKVAIISCLVEIFVMFCC